MLESLGRIRNPWIRSLTAAITAGSIVALLGAIIAGSQAKDKNVYRWAVYATGLAVVGGATVGLAYKERALQAQQQLTDDPLPTSLSELSLWKNWRNFKVVRKVKESEEITSFYLKPQDGGKLPSYKPGQFLTIKLDVPDYPHPVIRTYSLSDYPEPCDYYRLSIKRERAPKNSDVPPGIASNFLHDNIQEESVIQAKPPSGKFFLTTDSSLPIVLVSNGVGITPMIAMAKACMGLTPNRPIWFIHGARDGAYHAFCTEVREIAQQNSNLQVHFAYSRPQREDLGQYHSTGYVDTALLQSLVPCEAEFYLCGSPPFLKSIQEGLKDWGVPNNRIFFESFGAAKSTTSTLSTPSTWQHGLASEVVFTKSGKTLPWTQTEANLLDFAEAHDLHPDYSCRQGICGTCRCRILEGEVTYQTEPTAELHPGSVLICIARPKTHRVILDL